MISKPIMILLALGALITACTTMKRYSSIQPALYDNTLAEVDLFGFRLSDSKSPGGNKTLWDLSADAQSQFIKILNARYPDNERFLDAMSFKYLEEEATIFPGDYVSKDLRMIFSISKKRDFGNKQNLSGPEISPADRIEYLKLNLIIPGDSPLRFTGWNMFTTEYGSIDIADVSFSRSFEIETSGFLSADKKVTGGELSAGGKSSSGRREDQEIKFRYLKLNGRINRNEIELEAEGTREIDLTGNISVDISLQFDRFPELITDISGLKDSTGNYNNPERLTVQQTEAFIPRMENEKDTVYADLRMEYIFRNVINGQKTFPEWDDRIRYYKGSVSKRVTLFTSDDYVPDFYCIGTNSDPERRNAIKLVSSNNKEYNLIFRTYNDAGAFNEWLADYFANAVKGSKIVKIGGYTLKFNGIDLTSEIFRGLSVTPCYR